MKKKTPLTEQEKLENRLNEYRREYHPEPIRFFKVGEEVQYGNHTNALITAIYDNGLFYRIHTSFDTEKYGQPVHEENDGIAVWTQLYPLIQTYHIDIPAKLQVNYMQRDIYGLLSCRYHFGIDDEVDYQRELVWNYDQKIELLNSIFNQVDIGKFTLIHRDYKPKTKLYEILDGKQRMNTICEFYEGRIEYKGRLYYQYDRSTRRFFENHPISWGETRELSQKDKYAYFLTLNSTGEPIAKEHLNHVYELWRKA